MRRSGGSPPLVAHVIHRLDVGGLENGLVNLINHMPAERYRHAIVCLTGFSRFRERLSRPDVAVYALGKRDGQDWRLYARLWQILRRLRPDIVHTRNLAALEGQLPAALAGVRHRIHGEHGWEAGDLDGSRRRYQLLRRAFRPLVSRYIPMSRHLERYLHETIGVAPERICQIYNGVDTQRFHPPAGGREPLPAAGFERPDVVVVGSVGRMQAVKDPLTLVRAFLELLRAVPEAPVRLALLGDGPLRAAAERLLAEAGAADLAWLPGSRDDVPALLRGLDLFVLPSLNEGVSNTILEAMATGLPVVATRVGGNPELVADGATGRLVPAADPQALVMALRGYVEDPASRRAHGAAGRRRAERQFSLEAMVNDYLAAYDAVLGSDGADLRLGARY